MNMEREQKLVFFLSPQVNDRGRTFVQRLNAEKIRYTRVLGKTVLLKKKGEYSFFFQEENREFVDLSLEDIKINLVPEGFSNFIAWRDDRIWYLKWFGYDGRIGLRFPAEFDIDVGKSDDDVILKTCLNDFQVHILQWCDQLSELFLQVYNQYQFLLNEFAKDVPSPILVRSLKIGIVGGVILYAEAIANFLSSICNAIHEGVQGAPTPIVSVPWEKINRLMEVDRNFLPLEEKIKKSSKILDKLTGCGSLNFNDVRWGLFFNFKEKRNSMTHVKFDSIKVDRALDFNFVMSGIEIKNIDLLNCLSVFEYFFEYKNRAVECLCPNTVMSEEFMSEMMLSGLRGQLVS